MHEQADETWSDSLERAQAPVAGQAMRRQMW
jgi:hypothetical protein